jgi:hypothetical protein
MPLDSGDWQNFRSIQELLVAFYGGAFVTITHDSDFTIGTTAVQLTSNRSGERVTYLLSNTGATNFAISFNPAVAITTGILLLPGGTINFDWYYDGDVVQRYPWAISSAAGGTLHMLERFLSGA